jgi:hypothetical protein
MTSEGFLKKDGPVAFPPFHSDPAKSGQLAKAFRLMIGWLAGGVGQYRHNVPWQFFG